VAAGKGEHGGARGRAKQVSTSPVAIVIVVTVCLLALVGVVLVVALKLRQGKKGSNRRGASMLLGASDASASCSSSNSSSDAENDSSSESDGNAPNVWRSVERPVKSSLKPQTFQKKWVRSDSKAEVRGGGAVTGTHRATQQRHDVFLESEDGVEHRVNPSRNKREKRRQSGRRQTRRVAFADSTRNPPRSGEEYLAAKSESGDESPEGGVTSGEDVERRGKQLGEDFHTEE
jgi:hypothetical protein